MLFPGGIVVMQAMIAMLAGYMHMPCKLHCANQPATQKVLESVITTFIQLQTYLQLWQQLKITICQNMPCCHVINPVGYV
jgi:hypothetical protein